MATFLSKLFKPKWQSKHLPTRLEAIAALNENLDDEQKVLQQIALEDQHIEARSAAIAKVSSSQFLIDLHAKADEALKRGIETRLQQLANAQSLTLFDLIVDTRLLCEMIIKSDQPDVFINGLAHIEDPDALLQIATASKTSRTRQAAAELLETEQHLTELVQAAKSRDKSVYQIAKNKLNRIREELRARTSHRDAIAQLLLDLEDLSKTDNLQLYDAKLDSLAQRWQQHSVEVSTEEQTRFDSLTKACRQRSEQLHAEQQAAEQAEQLARAGGDEQAATLLMLEETLTRFQQQAPAAQDASALDALIKTQETRWLEATRHTPAERAQGKKYQTMMQALRQLLAALRALNEHGDRLAALTKEVKQSGKQIQTLIEKCKALQDTLSLINWPRQYAAPLVVQDAQNALEHSSEMKSALAENARAIQDEIQGMLKQLDRSLEDKQVKQSARLVRDIQAKLAKLDKRGTEKFQAPLSLYLKQLNDLRDWQSYAACPRQEALCEEMERLTQSSMEPRAKADKIRSMQKEWKTLGGASDQALWQRFKEAADRAYEPCQLYFEEQSRLKEKNLERRRTIVAQLNTFISENDWQYADWAAADKINQQARKDWKAAFPVDFKKNKGPQQEFNRLLKQLDDYLQQERERNHAIKEAIIKRAEALIEQEDLATAIQSAKDLQQEWQNVGITAHKVDRALWKRFRAACDAIFARRDQQRSERKEELNQNHDRADELLKRVEDRLQGSDNVDATTLSQMQSELRREFKQLGSLPRSAQEKIQNRYQNLLDTLNERIRKHKQQAERAAWSTAAQLAAHARRCYLASQNDALSDEQRATGDALCKADNGLPAALTEAMQASWISIKAGQLAPQHLLDEESARELCIRAEVAAGIDSPDSDKELRMRLQVSRLSEGLSNKSRHGSREEQLTEVLQDWYVKAGLDEASLAPFEARIQACVNALYGAEQ